MNTDNTVQSVANHNEFWAARVAVDTLLGQADFLLELTPVRDDERVVPLFQFGINRAVADRLLKFLEVEFSASSFVGTDSFDLWERHCVRPVGSDDADDNYYTVASLDDSYGVFCALHDFRRVAPADFRRRLGDLAYVTVKKVDVTRVYGIELVGE